MRKMFSLSVVLLVLVATVLSACGGAASTKLKVGLVTDTGGLNDK